MSVMYLRLIPHLVLVAALLAEPFAKSAPAQELPTAEQLNFGFQVVHGLLESRGLKTTADLKDVLGRPRSSVLVLVGDLGRNQILVRSRIRSFLQRGGAVLLASDKAQWIDELCVIKPGPVEVEDAFAYQGYNDCPRVQRLDHSHDLTASVRQLIANRSGWVDKVFTDHGQWHPVAWLPTRTEAGTKPKILIATMRSRHNRRGRIAVLADHSLLINGMFVHGDNGRFAMNVTDWLCKDRRDQVFFAVDGYPLTPAGLLDPDLSNLPPLPPPEKLPPIKLEDLKHLPPEALLPFANKLLASAEDADLHNELAASRPKVLSDRLYSRGLYFTLAIIGGLFVVRQLVRSGSQIDPPIHAPAQSAMEARVRNQIDSGEYGPAARGLARYTLQVVSGSDQPSQWVLLGRRVTVEGNWLLRWRVHSMLGKLNAIAVRTEGDPMSNREFQWLGRSVTRLQHLHQNGRLTSAAARSPIGRDSA